MTITREQVADLQPGDVVELRLGESTTIRGPLISYDGIASDLGVAAAGWPIRTGTGAVSPSLDNIAATLTVISRAPRPLYVNHPRTEPLPGDVVRDANDLTFLNTKTPWNSDKETWVGAEPCDGGIDWRALPRLTRPLRLLVDGKTGQVVP